jgi:steroid delta-isomerase-like uncharacterized protein
MDHAEQRRAWVLTRVPAGELTVARLYSRWHRNRASADLMEGVTYAKRVAQGSAIRSRGPASPTLQLEMVRVRTRHARPLHSSDAWGAKEGPMDLETTVRRFYDSVNAGDFERFGELMSEDFIEHEETPGLAPTKEGVLEFFRMYRVAFPDMRMDVEEVLISGDKTVVRARVTGTHKAEFMGMPATGRGIDVQLIDIMRFGNDGLAHEHWGVIDVLAMMQQLGAVPEGPPAQD